MSRSLFFPYSSPSSPPFSSLMVSILLLASFIPFSVHMISPFIFSHRVLAFSVLTADHLVAWHYIIFSQRVKVIHALSHFKSKVNKIKKARIAPECSLFCSWVLLSQRGSISICPQEEKYLLFRLKCWRIAGWSIGCELFLKTTGYWQLLCSSVVSWLPLQSDIFQWWF